MMFGKRRANLRDLMALIGPMCLWRCYSVLQCVAVCCSVLQCVAVWCSVLQCVQCVAVCCSVFKRSLESVAVNGVDWTYVSVQVLQCCVVCCSVLKIRRSYPLELKALIRPMCPCVSAGVAVFCIVLQCGVVCCSVLQCVAGSQIMLIRPISPCRC